MSELVDHPRIPDVQKAADNLRYWYRQKDTDSIGQLRRAEWELGTAERILEDVIHELARYRDQTYRVGLKIGEQAVSAFTFSHNSYDFLEIQQYSRPLEPGSQLKFNHVRPGLENPLYHPRPRMYVGSTFMIHSELLAQTLSENGSLDIVSNLPDSLTSE